MCSSSGCSRHGLIQGGIQSRLIGLSIRISQRGTQDPKTHVIGAEQLKYMSLRAQCSGRRSPCRMHMVELRWEPKHAIISVSRSGPRLIRAYKYCGIDSISPITASPIEELYAHCKRLSFNLHQPSRCRLSVFLTTSVRPQCYLTGFTY